MNRGESVRLEVLCDQNAGAIYSVLSLGTRRFAKTDPGVMAVYQNNNNVTLSELRSRSVK